jgi:MFS transporter, YNFM family, putative membrane transport protein
MTSARAQNSFALRLAAGIAGYCAFINLYSPQAILPLLSTEFGVGAAEISTTITVSTLAVALTAPFTGTVADVLGRKRVIVAAMFVLVIPTVMVSFSTSLSALVFWRAVQGLVLPPIFAVMVAYIGDELTRHEATTVAGIYSSGSSLGGFSGRLFVGLLADLISWRAGFMALAAIALAGAIVVAFLLPHERKFVRSEGLVASGKQMLAHLRNGQLLATYAVGFGVLFNFITTFTYVSFYLAAPPFNLSASWPFDFRGLSDWLAAYAVDRLGSRTIRTTSLYGASHRCLGRRNCVDAGAFTAIDRRRTGPVRGLRPDMPGNFDRICHRNR